MASTQEESAIAAYNEQLGGFDKDLFSAHLAIYFVHGRPLLSTVDLDEIEELVRRKIDISSTICFQFLHWGVY
jgi:hypothetical protein